MSTLKVLGSKNLTTGESKLEKNYLTRGKPEPGKLYSLTGGPGTPSIAAGNSWAESEVESV
tara:strand:- start:5349 stop:5531 length:183 start_codon:yes stop_codon:yes gene_type:complete